MVKIIDVMDIEDNKHRTLMDPNIILKEMLSMKCGFKKY